MLRSATFIPCIVQINLISYIFSIVPSPGMPSVCVWVLLHSKLTMSHGRLT